MSRELEIVQAWQRVAAQKQDFTAEDVTSEWKPDRYRVASTSPDASRLATVRHVLRTLEALGIIERLPNGSFRDTTLQTYYERQAPLAGKLGNENEFDLPQVNSADRPPEAPPPPPNDNSQGDGQGGGEGFREVLSHPYLLTLPQADFARLLETI